MRVLALIVFVMLAVANLVTIFALSSVVSMSELPFQTLRRRLDPPESTGPFFAWHDLRKPAFTVLLVAGAVAFLGLYSRRFCPFHVTTARLTWTLKVLTYIEVSAIAVGISPRFSFYLLSITSVSSGFGRIASGILGDKLGALNVSAPLTLVCAIMTYAWPFATTKGSLVAVGVIYGFGSGAYIALLPAPLVAMGDMHDAGRRTGLAMTGVALGALAGPPISGALIKTPGGFHTVSYYAGTVPAATTHP